MSTTQAYSREHRPPAPVLDIQIADLLLPVIEVVSDRWSEEILLGRNVLNRLDLRLEGPKLRTHILGG